MLNQLEATWVWGGHGSKELFFNHVCATVPSGLPGPRSVPPWRLVVARWWLLLLWVKPYWLLTSYPEAGSRDLRRNMFSSVLFGSNLTWKDCIFYVFRAAVRMSNWCAVRCVRHECLTYWRSSERTGCLHVCLEGVEGEYRKLTLLCRDDVIL
jgi:hypothetical protein